MSACMFIKPKELGLPGICHFPRAWLRANRECCKLFGQSMSIETAGLSDARLLLNPRTDVVDNTRFKAYVGEVVGQSEYHAMDGEDIPSVASVINWCLTSPNTFRS